MLSKEERDRLRVSMVLGADDERVVYQKDWQALHDTCDALEAEREKLAKCLERLGFVHGAPEPALREAVDDYVADVHRNADERIEAMAERDRLKALCREAAELFEHRDLYMDERAMIQRLREAGKEE